MITLDQAKTLSGRTLSGSDGEIGKIDTLYADRDGGEPTFATVNTGMFGSKTSFVPLADATLEGDTVRVPYSKDQVKDAPNIDEDSELSPEEEQRLYSHYNIGAQSHSSTGDGDMRNVDEDAFAAGGQQAAHDHDHDHGTVGHDTSGPNTDNAMTRSEERLQVGTQTQETGRARLRKFITSETVTETVPVTKEQVRVEREPVTEANAGAALDGPALSEEEHEVTLTEERPVVAKETVPVERVRLDKDVTQEQVQVSEELRKEEIDVDGVYPEGTSGQRTQSHDRA